MTRLTADDFNRLYREHARRVQGFFLRMTGDAALAEDLTQELFTRLWESRDSFDEQQGTFTTWMYGVAYNLCKNEYHRREVAERALTHIDSGDRGVSPPSGADNLERRDTRRQLAEAVRQLPDGLREVFLLRYVEELPIRDVALALGIPEGTVKSRAYTALATMREKMKQLNE